MVYSEVHSTVVLYTDILVCLNCVEELPSTSLASIPDFINLIPIDEHLVGVQHFDISSATMDLYIFLHFCQ